MTEQEVANYITSLGYTAINKEMEKWKGIKSINRVFGLPYKFTKETDYRPLASEGLAYGRQYLNKIVAEAPIVHFVPGVPSYMPGLDATEKSYIENYIKIASDREIKDNSIIEKVLGTEARYYDFIPAYAQYTRYVNILCRMASIYMGIGDKVVPGYNSTSNFKYKNFDWGHWSNFGYKALGNRSYDLSSEEANDSAQQKWYETMTEQIGNWIDDSFFNLNKYVRFYVDPSSSVSDSLSNSTTASQAASLFDSISPLVKELQFLSGGSGGIINDVIGGVTDTASGLLDSLSSAMSESSSSTMSQLIGQASHVLTGSNVIFPDIWQSSDYRKNYSFTINLVSPYGDPESIFLSIIVPMMHLISLAYPKQTGANSYASPFLVKAFSKGWFSSDMAIIDSISIDKGGDGAWTVDGFPTEVKVTISLSDLYSAMPIPPSTSPGLYFSNTSLMEFVAVTCGLDITSSNVSTKIDSVVSQYLASIFDIPYNVGDTIRQRLGNWIAPFINIGAF